VSAVAASASRDTLGRSRSARNNLTAGLSRLLRHQLAVLGGVLVLFAVGTAIFAPLIAPYDPNQTDFLAVLQPPSASHPLGTDDLGRDILSRLVYGARLSLQVSLAAVAVAALVGVPIGLVVGYLGGLVDTAVMRFMDSLMSLPSLVLALTIAAVLGSGLLNTTLAIAVVAIPTYARLMRGQVLSVQQNEYVLAARAIGAPTWLILVRYLLPNTISPVIVLASLGVGFAIITESSLSFIGLGAQPPTPTWGSMVQTGFQYLEIAPWFVMAPATMIFLAVLGFNLLGDGLRDALDPTMKVQH
jgi:peptide/nickel transport system permease protein